MIADTIGQLLTSLRRLARATVGDQQAGDDIVEVTLRRLASSNQEAPASSEVVQVYRCFFDTAVHTTERPIFDPRSTTLSSTDQQVALARLAGLDLPSRLTFLLRTMEGLEPEVIAEIRELSVDDVEEALAKCRSDLAAQLTTSILIIEDEPFVAADLESLIVDLGHRVTAKVSTRTDALIAVGKEAPGLVLSDVELADGSSGAEAADDILGIIDVPVIFITAYPERLLTGERAEPTFLIEKPFRRDDVVANISLALFFKVSEATG